MTRLLFVTWDGPQVSYLESLFLPIFAGLRAAGIDTDVLQFRWGSREQEASVRSTCEAAGIGYRAAVIQRAGGAAGAFATAVAGSRAVRAAAAEFGSTLLLPRSLMPALSVLLARLPLPILFDADGLAADEKVEFGGLSLTGLPYRILRGIEAQACRRASGILVRTPAAASILADRSGTPISRFHQVANGRDSGLFRPAEAGERAQVRASLGIAGDAPLLVYAGSVGPQYRFDLVNAVALALRQRRKDARLLILSGQPGEAAALLDPQAASMTIIRSVPADQVPGFMAAADVGLAYRATSLSTQAIAPVKLGEYLLCGLPVVGTAAIGDTAAAVRADVMLDEAFGPDRTADWILAKIAQETATTRAARTVGLEHFSLDRSVSDYREALAAVGTRERNSSTNRGA